MTPPVSDLSRRFRIPDFRDTMPSKQISRARFLFLHTQEKLSGDLPDSRLLRPATRRPSRLPVFQELSAGIFTGNENRLPVSEKSLPVLPVNLPVIPVKVFYR